MLSKPVYFLLVAINESLAWVPDFSETCMYVLAACQAVTKFDGSLKEGRAR